MPDRNGPPMDPTTSEATSKQLDLARAQGEAYGQALRHMTDEVAHDGGEQRIGDYIVGYAVEEAEGMYEWAQGDVVWRKPGEDNAHIEVAVRDAGDGRFVPGCTVTVTLTDPDGNDVGTHVQPLLWHPMIYHYGRNWKLPVDGTYRLHVHIDPPTFMRHDEVNGRRFLEAVDVDFDGVKIKRGQG